MSEIKILGSEDISNLNIYVKCQLCNQKISKYYLHCEINDMFFKLGVCENCYIQSSI